MTDASFGNESYIITDTPRFLHAACRWRRAGKARYLTPRLPRGLNRGFETYPEGTFMLTRGKLAARTGCNIETIRYYESIGLMPAPARSAAGYRQYGDEHLRRLNFIQRARALGFSSEKIQGLLELSRLECGHTRADVKALTEAHIDEITAQIRDLQKIRRRLQQISSYCDGSGESAATCPILESLFDDDSGH